LLGQQLQSLLPTSCRRDLMPAFFKHIVDKLTHFRVVIDNKYRTPLLGHAALLLYQDAEKVPQLRSRIVQTLNVPRGYASGFNSPAALLENFLSILCGPIQLSLKCEPMDLLCADILVSAAY
jgi:hypothetical protein